MENREILKAKIQKEGNFKLNKRELIRESLSAVVFCALAILLTSKKMLFETTPLAFALLGASTGHTPFVLIGIVASAFGTNGISLMTIVGACSIVAIRIITMLYLDKGEQRIKRGTSGMAVFYGLFSEHTYLRIMSGEIGRASCRERV